MNTVAQLHVPCIPTPEPSGVFDISRALFREQHRMMRRFRSAAVYWLYRAADVPPGHVMSPAEIARRLFGSVEWASDDYTKISRHPEAAAWILEIGSVTQRRRAAAWGCAALACSVLRDRMGQLIGDDVTERDVEQSIADELFRVWEAA